MPDALAGIFGGQEAEGKDIWENLALTSIGGLISSTILLLLALPAIYYMWVRIDWLRRRVGAALKRGLRRPAPPVVDREEPATA